MRLDGHARKKGGGRSRRMLVVAASLAMSMSVAACGSPAPAPDTDAAGDATEVAKTEPEMPEHVFGAEWVSDIRLATRDAAQLIAEAGISPAEWSVKLEEARQAGLKDQISLDDLRAADSDAIIDENDEYVYHIGPSSLFGKVGDVSDAYGLVFRLIETLGGNEDTCLYPISRITKGDITVYLFQQYAEGDEVLGRTAKVCVGADGEVSAIFASIDGEASKKQELATQKVAEDVAKGHVKGGAKVLSEYSELGIYRPWDFSVALDVELEGDPIPNNLVWIVYTENDGSSTEEGSDYPYLAHYVKVDGTYIKSLPVKEPGDAEARCGYRRQDVFGGLEPATYTCEVTDLAGKDKTVTVPVMHDKENDCYYLGDVERRIVVADFYEAAYGDHGVHPLRSDSNEDWDVEDVYTFHNYLRAWDFYADMGWIGPDGQNTDEVIFSGLCYRDKSPYENACSIGPIEAWQGFGYSPYNASGKPLRLGWGLDVMGHEYTHTFTSTVMGQNLYLNDLGAINESMSDIMGNLIEYICGDTDDTVWMLGENTPIPVRNMSDPNAKQQPAYVWDKFYGPHVSERNTANDNGGVHSNSSLLNLIAADLCIEEGMSYEEAVDLWTTVALGMTPSTDYPQIPALVRWGLEQSGLFEKYGEAFDALVAKTRIETYEKPGTLPDGRELVELRLPETDVFDDKGWALVCVQVDASKLVELLEQAADLVGKALSEPDGLDKLGEGMSSLMEDLHIEELATGSPILTVDEKADATADASGTTGDAGDAMDETGDATASADDASDIFRQLLLWARDKVAVVQLASWEEMDTGVMPIIVDTDKPTVYILMHVIKGGAEVDGMLVKLGDSWYDLGKLSKGAEGGQPDNKEAEKFSEALTMEVIENLGKLTGLGDSGAAGDGGEVTQLPTKGLEEVELGVSFAN